MLEEEAFTKEQMSIQAGALYTDSLIESANRYARELQEQGVETIIALVHEGGSADSSALDLTAAPDRGDLRSNLPRRRVRRSMLS